MNILFIILAFVISASVARLIIPRILLISLRKKLFDMPSERKVHKRAIPRLGGVSFFPTILLSSCGVFALRILMGYDVPALRAVYLLPECLFLVCGMTLLYLTGIADDLVGACYGYYFLEFADYFARENEDETAMLNLIYHSLRALLDKRIPDKLVRAVYELKQLVINGEYPEFFCCTSCGAAEDIEGFSISSNGVLCHSCHRKKDTIRILPATLYTLQFIVSTPCEKLYSFTVKDEVLTELTEVMRCCILKYLDKRMKSLDMLELVDK